MAFYGENGIAAIAFLDEMAAPAIEMANAFAAVVRADGVQPRTRHQIPIANDAVSFPLKFDYRSRFLDIWFQRRVVQREGMDPMRRWLRVAGRTRTLDAKVSHHIQRRS
jgi:hypothetical protein